MIVSSQTNASLLFFPTQNEPSVVSGSSGIPFFQSEDDGRLFTHDLNLENVLGSRALTDGQGNLRTVQASNDLVYKGRLRGLNDAFGCSVLGYSNAVCQISGTWVGTITFEGYADGGNFVSINATQLSGVAVPASTTTTNGIFQVNVSGLQQVQARWTIFTSGNPLLVWLVHSGASGVYLQNQPTMFAQGSQSQNLSQKVTTFELNTFDTNLSSVLGNLSLWRPGFQAYDLPQAPTQTLTVPGAYAAPQYSYYPQIQPRLRVEIGGSQKLPVAQQPGSLELMVVDIPARQLLEQIYVELKFANALQIQTLQAAGISMPSGWDEVP